MAKDTFILDWRRRKPIINEKLILKELKKWDKPIKFQKKK